MIKRIQDYVQDYVLDIPSFSGYRAYALRPKINTLIVLLKPYEKELVSRKYSYKTNKSYLYYNKNFINHIRKNPSEIKDEVIKDYLVYLSEEKRN